MRLSERVRVEIFIPDLPDPSYRRLVEELEVEFSYTFGGCTVVSAAGHFCSDHGVILPDNVNIVFTDLPLDINHDRLRTTHYVERVTGAIQEALPEEESILVALHGIYHIEK